MSKRYVSHKIMHTLLTIVSSNCMHSMHSTYCMPRETLCTAKISTVLIIQFILVSNTTTIISIMTITQEEGNEIAEKVLASWTAGFVKNNHSEQ